MDAILLRHGIAINPEDWPGPDAERPLTNGGVQKTREALRGLFALDIRPTHIVASPYVRAAETAALAREVLRVRGEVLTQGELTPDADPAKLFAILGGLPADACVLCVGHEPHLSAVAGLMLIGEPASTLAMKKAGACCFRFDDAPTAGRGMLRWWMMPNQLRRLGRA
jgi:phosphohistidine phosphatase